MKDTEFELGIIGDTQTGHTAQELEGYEEIKLLLPSAVAAKIRARLSDGYNVAEEGFTYGIVTSYLDCPDGFVGNPDYPTEKAACDEALRLLKIDPKATYSIYQVRKVASVYNQPTIIPHE